MFSDILSWLRSLKCFGSFWLTWFRIKAVCIVNILLNLRGIIANANFNKKGHFIDKTGQP